MTEQGRTVTPRLDVQATSDLNTLAENLKEVEGKTGDLAEQVQANLKNIVWGVALIIGLSIGAKWMLEARERAQGAASQRFEGAQRDFEELYFSASAPSEESKATMTRAFEDKLKAITEVDSRSSYAQFSELYRIAAAWRGGDLERAKSALAAYQLSALPTEGKLTPEQFKLELALLLKGKVLSSVVNSESEGEALLRGLAEKGRVFAGEALLAHQRTFGLDEALVSATLNRLPQLRESLSADLSALGLQVQR